MSKKRTIMVIALAALLVAGLMSPLASSKPDGFERVGEDLGFIEHARVLLLSPLHDYSWPGVADYLSGPLAGVAGVVLTAGIVFVLGKLLTGNPGSG